MTALLYTTAVFFVSYLALFLLWVLVCGFKRAREENLLSPTTLAIGYGVLAIGYAVDVWCNVLCYVLFLDFPSLYKEPTVSERLRRLVHTTGWRRTLAIWFAVNLINPFSVGGPHINLPTV